jgi:tryptophan 2,3-dioxygenase
VTFTPPPAPKRRDELVHDPAWQDHYAHIEGLIGEEDALLRIPAHERTDEQRERLRSIGDELDRLWDALRRRAEGLAGPAPSG